MARAAARDQGAQFPDAEVIEVSADDVRTVLPISVVPCVLLMFDELTEAFEAANIGAIVKAVKAKKLKPGRSSGGAL